ncbi:MAG: flavin reductase family protein [Deltaproteobacteria bacterium]|nr:flavin reductase family protein [Deltaproteobacteria bacterium]
MHLDATTLPARDAYAWLTGLVVPRPIAWITTRDDDGHVNLAPFSYFNALASDPPMVTVAFATRRDGSDKDTLRLLRKTGRCCVNLVEEPDLDRMNATSAELPAHESEAARYGIDVVACDGFDGVRVASARAALCCVLVDVHRYGRKQGVGLAVLEVTRLFVDDALLDPAGRLVPERLRPVARLGGNAYALPGPHTSRDRP